MAFDDKNILNNKLSPLIEGQVPDFIQSDHPLFVNFLKDYYKFLEAGQLKISTTTDYVALETSSSSYVLEETDGDRIVTELGAGSKGFFIADEIITGSTSNATAKVLVDDSRNSRLFITSQQKFITGETITGGTSGSEGTVVEYRANPVQNIQQLLDYADVDNTIYDFLDKMRDSFMTDMPDDLASGVSRRNLIKNIKDLYAAKGTSEGHKLFMRMLLGEDAEIFYPNQYMIGTSEGQWEKETVLRVLAFQNVDGEEVVNQNITGQTSGATATVVSALVSQQTSDNFNDSVTEFIIANLDGTFQDGEVVSGVSTQNDREVKFTVFGIIDNITVNRGGSLYSKNETIELENVGNNFGEIVVDEIKSGSVGAVVVDDAGINYEVGDAVVFTANSVDTDIQDATAEVSMVGGGILQESGTLDDSSVTTDNIVFETSTVVFEESFNFILEGTREDVIITDGSSTEYTLSNINATFDTIQVFRNGRIIKSSSEPNTRGVVVNEWTASGSTLTFREILPAGEEIVVRHTNEDFLLLDGTTSGGEDAGYRIESNSIILRREEIDLSSKNKIVLEYDTFENLGVTSERGSIQKVRIINDSSQNKGYTKLPTVSITTTGGTGAKLLAVSNTIGQVQSVKIINNGFRYVSSNPPDVDFRSHFILKDVTGTFVENNTLTSHTGTVKAWDTTTNELVISNFDYTEKIVQEQDGTFQEGIQLEQATELLTPKRFLLEDEQSIPQTGFGKTAISKYFSPFSGERILSNFPDGSSADVDEDRIVLDSTDVFDPLSPDGSDPFSLNYNYGQVPVKRVTIKVSAKYDLISKVWYFLLDGKRQKNLTLYQGTEYYFDLSHPSLYGNPTGLGTFFALEDLEKSFALSITPDGSRTSGTEEGTRETTYITTTQKYGVGGAFDNIRVGGGNPLDEIPKVFLEDFPFPFIIPPVYTEIAPPPAIFSPFDAPKQGLIDQNQFGTSEAWTEDELYSIQKGYTGAYLKILIPADAPLVNSKYYYYSPNYDTMGGVFTIKRMPKVKINEGVSLCYDATDKQEFSFILENGSQDRTIIADETRATDKLLMEDTFVFTADSTAITEKDLINRRYAFPDFFTGHLTDQEYLNLWYDHHGVSDIEGYRNLLAQQYEPTFFMNEDYQPPVKFWNQTVGPKYSLVFGTDVPSAKDHIFPIQFAKKTFSSTGSPVMCQPVNIFPNVLPPTYVFPKQVFGVGGNVLLDSFREQDPASFILLDGTDASGSDAGDFLAKEDFGNTLVLDGTDTDSSDANDGFLLDDETGDGNIILNATASGVDEGDELILESSIDFRNGVSITDSGGATGTVVAISKALGSSTVGTTSTSSGFYRGINHLLGEDLIRIQDSYYYQKYSYEVIVGQSLSTYLDELKRAVHPAGFEPFGKVSIATLVSAAVTNTAAGVSDFTSDTTTFSPILASALETIFSQVLQSRLQVPTASSHDGHVVAGSFDDKIVQETGVLPGENLVLDVTTEFNLVLDGIDSNGTDAGFAIVLDGTINPVLNPPGTPTNAGDNIIILDDGSNIIFEDENLLSELGVDAIVLDGTDEDGSNAGDNIRVNAGIGIDLEDGLSVTSTDTFLYEESTVTSTDDITNGVGDGGGRIMSETSYTPSGQADRVVFSTIVKKLISRPLPKFERNLLLYLAETPFGSEPCGITLESGSGNLTDNIIMDGEIPFAEGSAFMELERDSEIDNIVLDGTDSLGSNAGDGLILETGFFLKIEDPSLGRESETFRILFENDGKVQLEASRFAFPVGFRVSDGNKLLLDTLDNDETITLSDIGSLSFDDIRRPDRIEIQGLNANEENWGGATDDDNITLEDFGQILLNASDNNGSDDGNHLLQETTKRNRFTLEQSGNLIVEKFSSLSNFAAVELETSTQAEIGDDLLLEDSSQEDIPFNIKLEDDENVEGVIILNGTDSSSTDANDKINLEEFFNEVPTDYKILLEEHNVFAAEGQIPVANYTLNSTSVITKGNVLAADISVRDTGDITLEDATDNAEGYLVLNSTSGSSTNAGENIDLEGATGITY